MTNTNSTAPAAAPAPSKFSIQGHLVFAGLVMGFLVFGLGGWAATANLSGAIIAPGSFVVERNVKKVQHSYGGIVSEINVRNGEKVEYLHQGIAQRAFERRFELADFVVVEGAEVNNGLLHVTLERHIPEAMKPRTIQVKGASSQKTIESKQAA